MTNMTDAQQEAHEQIHRLMSEHFDAGVLVILYEGHNGTQSTDSMKVTHHGGFAQAIGLCEIGKNWILHKADDLPA